MRKIIFCIFLSLFVCSCTTTQEIIRPDGKKEFLIACGASLGWNICYEKTNNICPNGYETVSEDAGFNRKELRIVCPLEEIPSPPIFKILRDYIPLIHQRRVNELVFWKKVKPFIKRVQELVEIRNKVAHTGKIPEEAGSIHDNLELVSDLLYLLDVLAGHDWAKSLASYEFRKALDWPNPTHGRITLTISEGY